MTDSTPSSALLRKLDIVTIKTAAASKLTLSFPQWEPLDTIDDGKKNHQGCVIVAPIPVRAILRKPPPLFLIEKKADLNWKEVAGQAFIQYLFSRSITHAQANVTSRPFLSKDLITRLSAFGHELYVTHLQSEFHPETSVHPDPSFHKPTVLQRLEKINSSYKRQGDVSWFVGLLTAHWYMSRLQKLVHWSLSEAEALAVWLVYIGIKIGAEHSTHTDLSMRHLGLWIDCPVCIHYYYHHTDTEKVCPLSTEEYAIHERNHRSFRIIETGLYKALQLQLMPQPSDLESEVGRILAEHHTSPWKRSFQLWWETEKAAC